MRFTLSFSHPPYSFPHIPRLFSVSPPLCPSLIGQRLTSWWRNRFGDGCGLDGVWFGELCRWFYGPLSYHLLERPLGGFGRVGGYGESINPPLLLGSLASSYGASMCNSRRADSIHCRDVLFSGHRNTIPFVVAHGVELCKWEIGM